tara:strand:+ start:4718 stop:5242 length:525 start_codon:yes stop_codon:yes gene_type:complete
MFFKIKFILITILILIGNVALSNENIAYVDMDLIMNSSKAGKLIAAKLSEEHKSNINYFKKKEDELMSKEKKLIAQQNIIDKSELEKQLNALQIEANEYRQEKNKRINDLSEKKLKATKKLLESINPILSEYADKNSISILMQKKDIVIGKTSLDKTDEILKIIDKKINKINLN